MALYLLMWAVPAIALLRQYGSGRAFAPFGIPLWPVICMPMGICMGIPPMGIPIIGIPNPIMLILGS